MVVVGVLLTTDIQLFTIYECSTITMGVMDVLYSSVVKLLSMQ